MVQVSKWRKYTSLSIPVRWENIISLLCGTIGIVEVRSYGVNNVTFLCDYAAEKKKSIL